MQYCSVKRVRENPKSFIDEQEEWWLTNLKGDFYGWMNGAFSDTYVNNRYQVGALQAFEKVRKSHKTLGRRWSHKEWEDFFFEQKFPTDSNPQDLPTMIEFRLEPDITASGLVSDNMWNVTAYGGTIPYTIKGLIGSGKIKRKEDTDFEWWQGFAGESTSFPKNVVERIENVMAKLGYVKRRDERKSQTYGSATRHPFSRLNWVLEYRLPSANPAALVVSGYDNSGWGWQQESYYTGDKDVRKRALELRKKGYKVIVSSMGMQVTEHGRMPMTSIHVRWSPEQEPPDKPKEMERLYRNPQSVSRQIFGHAKKFAELYAKGDYKGAKKHRMAITKALGEGNVPFAPTAKELRCPVLFAKTVACVSKVQKGQPMKCRSRKNWGETVNGKNCVNPFAVCRATMKKAYKRKCPEFKDELKANPKRPTIATQYLSKEINYGGEMRTIGSVRKELQEQGVPRHYIDAYMMGVERSQSIGNPKRRPDFLRLSERRHSQPLHYKPEDFSIISGADTHNPDIAYIFKSSDGNVVANVFWRPNNVEMRGMVGEFGIIYAVYPLWNRKGVMDELPKADGFLDSLIRILERGEYDS